MHSQAKLPQITMIFPDGVAAKMPRGMPRTGGAGALPGEPDEACSRGSQEPVFCAPGPALPITALVVGLRAQREVFGVGAQAVVAAMRTVGWLDFL